MEHDHYDIVVNYIIANQKKFYRLAYTYVRNENDALDIVQNAICSALEHYGSIREISYIKTWFYRVLVHESLNYIRKKNREIASGEPLGEEAPMWNRVTKRRRASLKNWTVYRQIPRM